MEGNKMVKSELKVSLKKSFKPIFAIALVIMAMLIIGVVAFAAEGTPVAYADFESIFTALQGQISVSTIVGVLAAVTGACVGLVFMWWGLRKVVSMLMAAFRKGKMSV